ncbi:tRNA N(3)-methylcytidine methyltransferase METTL2-like isoform X2 [Ipomoea triloba]|uniref:tRNA N(3)-methylcytidine methyltransferase METTL2-like isoform X2 n=1 Tax=Ipomoea triloba TaxID=35885 RepID=UPI00125DC063|nr:tRNA N(3)-methylcytidine methyltransferase METTL2-like isoform X2 [Ipomoea triloba]
MAPTCSGCSIAAIRLINGLFRASLSFPVRQYCCESDHYYSKKSLKYWNDFYKRHQNKFFKDRHYLEKDWGRHFSNEDGDGDGKGKVVLEVGCGAGNSIFPLVAAFPRLIVHACDFSPQAVALVKSHENFDAERIHVFVCDAAKDDLSSEITSSTVDVVTLIFMLSAVSPNKMPSILQNCKKVLKPNGHILFRDYALGDSAQVKLHERNQMISQNFYFRGDGTCSFYFSKEFLSTLFVQAGFDVVDINTYCMEIENRYRNITMPRRWLRAVFRKS